MILGCHVKMAAPLYLEGSVKEALSYGADAFMVYTGAPQNTIRKPVEELHVKEAHQLMMQNHIAFENMIVHAPYIINPANAVKKEVAELAEEFLEKEVRRTAAIGAKYLILHPGSYTSTDAGTGIHACISQLNRLEISGDVVICLETMAGKGSEIGRTFEELAEILEGLKHPEHFGVCLDTCHINDAGYEIDPDVILPSFDHMIGLKKLHVVHLNDSKNPKGSHKDRHANIGMGTIGFEKLYRFASDARLSSIPKILETPYIHKKPPYKTEISMLQSGMFDQEKLKAYEEGD